MEMETLAQFKQVIYKEKMGLACNGKDRSWRKNLDHSLRRDCNNIEIFCNFLFYIIDHDINPPDLRRMTLAPRVWRYYWRMGRLGVKQLVNKFSKSSWNEI